MIKDRNTAKLVSETIHRFRDEMQELHASVKASCTPQHFTTYNRAVSRILHHLDADILQRLYAAQDRLLNDPEFEPEFNQLSDATLATDTDLSEHNVRALYQRSVFSTSSRRAVVAITDFAYGMARMLQTYAELSRTAHPVVEVFRDRTSALKWLGIPEDFLNTLNAR